MSCSDSAPSILSGTTTTSTFLCLPSEVAPSCRGPFSGTVTIDVIANDGSPFDGVLTLYAGKSSTVVATGTSLGSGETFLQFDGGSTYSSYTLELQDNGNDQTGGYTIFVNIPGGPLYTPTGGNDTVTGTSATTCWSGAAATTRSSASTAGMS